ncbi:heparan-alpha-glucosaminide N-acetyltransferase domain-containing protein [Corynebacterium sp. J010B-136]|uniref:heparan-alpha-glucosaminide N-acetyltransferase domain-containing protein n=1 Tax=Corynebacterium sp. J010B-136 TaxID=2099401 RepID=UPI001304988D|nr:heparan-alpha-glucosaminide N-acetyltransferase domain-containing protein [Corynebacterium sp. J010B-136]
MRPEPGASGLRKVWTGRYDDGDPILLNPDLPVPHDSDKKQFKNKRIIGIDVARGLALIGMMAVHTLPSHSDNGSMSLAFWLAAGNAAALFAILAGVGLAFASGGADGATGLKLRISRKRLFLRALAIFVIGLLVNQIFSPVVFNILPYYGLLFLFAVFFLGMRMRWIAISAGLTLAIMPVCIYLINHYAQPVPLENVTVVDLFQTPLAAINTLLFIGAYPVATWFFYILIGLIIGRMQLKIMSTQAYLPFFGFLLAIGTWMISYAGFTIAGGNRTLLAAEPQLSPREIERFRVFGAEFDYLPHNTWLWNLIAAPHANTALSILHSTGVALTALGICLLLCRVIPRVLSPLALMGSMTLTLYVGHQLYMTYSPSELSSLQHFFLQLGLGLTFAFVWTRFVRQGPLEWVVSKASKGGDTLLESTAARHAKGQRGSSPSSS